MKWTKRSRIDAVFNGEQPDRVPVYDLLVNDAAVEYYSGQKLEIENGYETVCKAVSKSLDMTRDISGPRRIRDYVDHLGIDRHDDRWSSWITRRPFDNDDNKLIKFIKDDIDILKSKRSISENEIINFRNHVKYTQCLIGETVNLYVNPNINVNYCFNAIGMEAFCLLIYDEPELVAEWMKSAAEYDLLYVDTFASYNDSPVSLIYADVAQKGNLIFPKAFLVKQMMPHVNEVCDILHDKGMKAIFHSDGNIMSILDELYESGVDGLNPLEVAAGMDIKAIKEKFGRKFIICGGIDASSLLPYGSRDDVISETKNLISLAAKDFGLCLGSTTEIENCVPLDNIRAMIDTCHEYGKYPLKL